MTRMMSHQTVMQSCVQSTVRMCGTESLERPGKTKPRNPKLPEVGDHNPVAFFRSSLPDLRVPPVLNFTFPAHAAP